MPVHQHRSRATKVLAVVTLALVCAAFASEVQPASARAKAKPKSRSKIIDLSPPTRYVLSISGNFTEKKWRRLRHGDDRCSVRFYQHRPGGKRQVGDA